MTSINPCFTEKEINEFIQNNINKSAEKLLNFSLILEEKNKILNEDLERLKNFQKTLKLKEINNSNKKVELLMLERRLLNKNNNKVSLKNILECYQIILKNNEELLNRRLDQLKERDYNLKKKEFLLTKIKSNLFNIESSSAVNQDYSKYQDLEKKAQVNINEELILEQIHKQFKLFQIYQLRNINLDISSINDNKNNKNKNNKKLEIQNNEALFINNSNNFKKINDPNSRSNIKNRDDKTIRDSFGRITEENEDILSRKNSMDGRNSNLRRNTKDLFDIYNTNSGIYCKTSLSKTKEKNCLLEHTDQQEVLKTSDLNEKDSVLKISKYEIRKNYENSIKDLIKPKNYIRRNNSLNKNHNKSAAYEKIEHGNFSETENSKSKRNLSKSKKNDISLEKPHMLTKVQSVKSSKRIGKVLLRPPTKSIDNSKYSGLARGLSGNKSFNIIRNTSNDPAQMNFNIANKYEDNVDKKTNIQLFNRNFNEELNNNYDNFFDKINKNNSFINNIIPNNLDGNFEKIIKNGMIRVDNIRINNENEYVNHQIGNMMLREDDIEKNIYDPVAKPNMNSFPVQDHKKNSSVNSHNTIETKPDVPFSKNEENQILNNSNKEIKVENYKPNKDKKSSEDTLKKKDNIKNSKTNISFSKDNPTSKDSKKDLNKNINKNNNIQNKNSINNKTNKPTIVQRTNSTEPKKDSNYQSKESKETIVKKNSRMSIPKRTSANNQANENNNKINNIALIPDKSKDKNNNNKISQKISKNKNIINNDNNNNKVINEKNNKNNNNNNNIKKRLDFEKVNKNENEILTSGNRDKTPGLNPTSNILLESKNAVVETEKDNEMKIIIENEKILTNEIYLQNINKYDEELITKKPIFFNDINFDDLKSFENSQIKNSISNLKDEKSILSYINNKFNQNQLNLQSQNPYSNIVNVNEDDYLQMKSFDASQNILKDEISNISDINLNINLNTYSKNMDFSELNNDQYKDNVIVYENDFSKSLSHVHSRNQSNINETYSATPLDLMRNSVLEKKNNNPFNILQKTAYESAEESPKNSILTKSQETDASPIQRELERNSNSKNYNAKNKIVKFDRAASNKYTNNRKNNNINDNIMNNKSKRYSANNAVNDKKGVVNKKNNILIKNSFDFDLIDSLDGSINKKSTKSTRKSIEPKSFANEKLNGDFKNKTTNNNNKNSKKLDTQEEKEKRKNTDSSKKNKNKNNRNNLKPEIAVLQDLINEKTKILTHEENATDNRFLVNNNQDKQSLLDYSDSNIIQTQKYTKLENTACEKKASHKERDGLPDNVNKTDDINTFVTKNSETLKNNINNSFINTNNASNKNNSDNTILSDKNIEKYVLKMDTINHMSSDCNGKYDTNIEDEADDGKIVEYQEYIKKMKKMAVETKVIEDNMRQFADIVQNLIVNNNTN